MSNQVTLQAPTASDFFLELPFGVFRFRRRTYKHRMEIRAGYLARTRQFADMDEDLSGMAQVAAEYSVLCSECPAGWESIDELDLTQFPERESQALDLFLALQEKERSFRSGPGEAGAGEGQGTERPAGVLVPEKVQPESAGSAVPGTDAGGN